MMNLLLICISTLLTGAFAGQAAQQYKITSSNSNCYQYRPGDHQETGSFHFVNRWGESCLCVHDELTDKLVEACAPIDREEREIDEDLRSVASRVRHPHKRSAGENTPSGRRPRSTRSYSSSSSGVPRR